MKVLLLGAGASYPAGYPLTAELMGRLEGLATNSANVQIREAWQAWERFLDGLAPELSLVARNSNAEVVLTLPDLFTLAVDEEDRARQSDAIRRYREGTEVSVEDLEKYYDSPERDALQTAKLGRARFLACLDNFFWYRHHYDAEERNARDYLRGLFDDLGQDDVVITLNWDTTAERTLGEEGKWSPIKGYGFERPLRLKQPMTDPIALPSGFPVDSTVKVLKLHGSFGWRQTEHGVYLEGTRFLREMPFRIQGRDIEFVDPDEPFVAMHDDLFLAYPSFLKKLSHPVVDDLWRQASAALLEAEHVEVWGYSLPDSDGAMRALLQPLAMRLGRRDASVVVHSPDNPVLERWKRMLGPDVDMKCDRLTPGGVERLD